MSTKRSTRWNGELDSLAPDFLKEVIEKMDSYGDRVQFEAPGRNRSPCYQVLNPRGMKMGFDSRHLLLRPNADGDVSDELTTIFTLEAVKAAQEGRGRRTAGRSVSRGGAPAVRAAAGRKAAAPAEPPVDTVERDKYAYFKSNRDFLPEGIARHSQQISSLMRAGMAAEQAFEAVIKEHF